VLDVLGQDHVLHGRSLDALLEEIGEPKRPEFVLYQYITFEGQKMSTRAGRVVFLDQLVDEAVARARKEILARRTDLTTEEVDGIAADVAAAAIRYLIIRVAPDKTVEFRWDEALSFEGRSGPFIQYAYARACSLLRKAEQESGPYSFDAARLREPDELQLVRIISRMPQVVAYVARTAHVHTLATYAHEVADQFNRFYQTIPVLKSTDERASRVALVAATRQALGNCLTLLGIARLERM
jgi:arginyl-tRNA synthetase